LSPDYAQHRRQPEPSGAKKRRAAAETLPMVTITAARHAPGGFSGQKNGACRPRLVHPRGDADKASRLQSDDVLRLGAFLALGDGELNALTFGQGLEARAGDGAEVCEHIRAGFLLDEAKAFCFVEPFNDASGGRHIHILIIKCWYGLIKGRWCWKCSGYL